MKEQFFKEFFEKSPTAYSYHRVILNDHSVPYDHEFLEVNKAYENMMGFKVSDIVGKRFYEVFPQKCQDTFNKALRDAVMHNKTVHFDMQHDVIQKYLRVKMFPLGKDHFACILKDVTKEYMQNKEIEGFLKVNLDMLCVADTDGNFLKVNKEFESVLGYKVDELEGKSFVALVHEDDIPSTLEVMKDLEEQKSISGFINRFRCKDGTYRYLEWRSQPNGKHIYASARDITDKRKKEIKLNKKNEDLIKLTGNLQKKNEVLELLAVTDELTGLYNRHYLDIRIEEEMASSDRYHQPLSMIIFDLDYFKHVNDKWGHPVGDRILKQTAEIANNIIRKSDILVRLGGEEFVVLMPQTTINGALNVAEKIRKSLDKNIHPVVGKVTGSFGVAERKKAEPFYRWYKRVDEALYQAKEEGRNRVASSGIQDFLPFCSVHFEWNSEWESGNKEIDEQHQKLLEIANSLIRMSLSDVGFERTMHKLDKFLNHIIQHFNSEEYTLMNIGYPGYEEHAKIHKGLVTKALQLKKSYQNGELKASAFFSFVVDDVIIGHMLESDAKFFPFIQNNDILV